MAAVREMQELCAQFAKMHRTTLAYKSTRNVKGAIVDEQGHPLETSAQVDAERELEECTFRPAINAKSHQLELSRRAATAAARAAAQAAADAPAEDFAAASAAYASAAAAARCASAGGVLPALATKAGGRHQALFEHAAGLEARRAQKQAEAPREMGKGSRLRTNILGPSFVFRARRW